MNPKISIITVVYNAEKLIEATIKSILSQTNTNYEMVVIDGGSTDRTVEIINQYRTSISYFISEKDKGIYDAMNKGIAAASGEWLFFLNAGDLFASEHVLEEVADELDKVTTDIDMVYGDICFYDKQRAYVFRQQTNQIKLNLNPICHQAIFTRRAAQHLFDLNYKLCADHAHAYQIFRSGRSKYMPGRVIAKMLMGGASSNVKQTTREKFNISFRYGRVVDKTVAVFFWMYNFTKFGIKRLLMMAGDKYFIKMQRLKNKVEGGV
ncbi:glycosyltransferase family 2 protein [Chitinophaga sp. CB10]|uniref:glycosyltransferase family 2 protein n=1 Tax=Chitinophaga sp. CB10 TaxID=1891659 RepID=UPI0025C11096|nr:glycosyltransferase family 2 protein [Chitinophaga sp. CB10]